MAFGLALRTIRERIGLSQEEASLRSGTARDYFGRMERGDQNPTYATMIKLAEGLGVTPQDLVALAEDFRRTDAS